MDPSQQGDDLKIEVMQLSAPTFSKNTSLPSTKSSNPTLQALNKINQRNQLLILPSKLVSSHLGEPFRICCAIRRKVGLGETEKILDLEVEVSMKSNKINNNQTHNKSVLFKTESPVCLNDHQDSTDFVAVHDLRSSGAHRLEIYVSYIVESVNIIDNSVVKKPSYMRKIYDIQVETPIKIVMNYPYLNTRTCLAEASIENTSTTDVNLTKFLLEPVEGFEFIDKIDEEAQFYLRPHEKATRTFLLQLNGGKPFKAGKYKFGRLNIVWRRGISCVGRLQTPALLMERKPEVAVEYNLVRDHSVLNSGNGDSEFSNINKIALLKTQNLEINIVNTTDSEVCVDLSLKENEYGDSVKFIGSLEHKNLVLESGSDCKVFTKFVSIRRGIHSLPSVFCTDSVTNKVQKFVDVKKVLVS